MERADELLYGLSLLLAPVLLGLSTLLWEGGSLGRQGGVLQLYSFVLWIPAHLGLLALVRPSAPRFAAWGQLLVAAAGISGACWAMDGIYLDVCGELLGKELETRALIDAMGSVAPLVLLIPGAFFPLSNLMIGVALWRSRRAPTWNALLLCLAGVAFPISRIPRIQPLAHAVDLLLVIAAWALAAGYLFRRRNGERHSV